MLTKPVLVFSDIHSQESALEVILNHARVEGIQTVMSLGDEHSPFLSSDIDSLIQIRELYNRLARWKNEDKNRRLICLPGDTTYDVPEGLWGNYNGHIREGDIFVRSIYREGNIIASHWGERIYEKHKEFIKNYDGRIPLVIFHGHSHSIGVLQEFKWLRDEEIVDHIEEGERVIKLERGKVYWANPGSVGCFEDPIKGSGSSANFLVYDPINWTITLKSIPYTTIREKNQKLNIKYL